MKTVLFFLCLVLAVYSMSKDWKRLLLVLSGWGGLEAFNTLYDIPFWLWMQKTFGVVLGSTYASIGALVLNFGLLIYYQSKGVDWLGVNLLEELKKDGHEYADNFYNGRGLLLKVVFFIPTQAFKVAIWSLNKTEWTTFLCLSVFTDSFITTVFMRHGKFGSLSRRDMKVFLLSTLISCGAWSVFMATVLEIAHFLFMYWRHMTG